MVVRFPSNGSPSLIPWSTYASFRRPWTALTWVLPCLILVYLFLRTAPFERRHGWIAPSERFEIVGTEPEGPGSFDWHTESSFQLVDEVDISSLPVSDLCKYFPKHLLTDIQPVLKTGHGVRDTRLRQQLRSVSACMTNLLIFSDVNERYEGRDIHDVIAEIPSRLTDGERQLRAWRNGVLAKDHGSNEVSPDTKKSNNAGWSADKFKFMPSISLAWKMRPGRRWYVFYEDDTYVVWDTVFRLLEHYDPDLPYYFGSPTPPTPGWEGTWFANGGPGYILSREAIRRLTQDDYDQSTDEYLGSKLTERYFDYIVEDCCGDSIVGWALWQQNVSMSGFFPMFNPHPPHGVPFSHRYWCQPILTMHGAREQELSNLWRWEWNNIDLQSPLTYRDLALSYFDVGNLTIREDWNNAGFDGFTPPASSSFYSYDPHASFEACGSACKAHNECFQWNYHLRQCHFMRSVRLGEAEEPGYGFKGARQIISSWKMSAWDHEDLRYLSGWDTEKINRWIDETLCEEVQWVKPSTKRIF